MGRSADKGNDDLPTVGIYGICMKRAIFKIGRTASVTTCHRGEAYRVTIPIDWSTNEEKWDFPIAEIEDVSDVPFLQLAEQESKSRILMMVF